MKQIKKNSLSVILSVILMLSCLQLPLIALADDCVSAYLGKGMRIFDGFEYSGFSLNSVWETSFFNGEDGSKNVTNSDISELSKIVEDPSNSANHVLRLGTTNNLGSIIYSVKPEYLSAKRKIEKFSFKIFMQNTNNPSYAVIYHGLSNSNESKDLCTSLGFRSNNLTYSLCDKGNNVRNYSDKGGINSSTWTDVSIEYIYDHDRMYGFNVTIGNNTQKFTFPEGQYTPIDQMKESNFSYGFMLDNTYALVDDVSFEYESIDTDKAEDIASYYRSKNSDVLSLNSSTVNQSDLSRIEKVLSDIDAMRSDVSLLFKEDKSNLLALCMQIKNDIADEEASSYRNSHIGALSLTTDSATVDNLVVVNQSVEDYLNLSTLAKEKLTSEYNTLFKIQRSLKGEKIDSQVYHGLAGGISDNFEYETNIIPSDIYSTSVFNNEKTDKDNNTSLKGHIVEDPTNKNNHVLALDSAEESNRYLYTLNNTYYPKNRNIQKISMRYYTKNSNSANNVNIVLYSGTGIDGKLYQNSLGMRSGETCSFIVNENTVNYTDDSQKLPNLNWCDIQIEYQYSQYKLTGWKIILTYNGKNYEKTYDFDAHSNGLGKMKASDFKVGISFGTDTVSYIDDLCFTFTQTESEKAKYLAEKFKSKYSDFLSRDVSSFSQSDKSEFDSVLLKYGELSELAKSFIPQVNSFLISVAENIYFQNYNNIINFINSNNSYLSQDISLFSSLDLTRLKQLYNLYVQLPQIERVLLDYPYKMDIDNALKYINDNPTVTGDISGYENGFDINADFEYGQNPFLYETKDDGQYYGKIIDDPTNSANNVYSISLNQPSGCIYAINNKIWPTGSAQICNFSFKMYANDINNFVTPRFIYDYQDPENYKAITFQLGVNGKDGTLQLLSTVDGVDTRSQLSQDIVELNKWVNFSFTYGESKVVLVVSSDTKSYSTTLNFQAGSQIAFAFLSGYGFISKSILIDDVKLHIEKRDFDVNQQNNNIIPYFTGNTFQNPNDTILLTGDGLYNNVEKGLIYSIPNSDIDCENPQYIFESRHDSSKLDSQIKTMPSSFSGDQIQSSEINFVQKTKTSLKFVLPAKSQKSVYAVVLKNKNSSYNDGIVYLNNPHITYVMGDDGDVSTQNGWLRIIGENLFIDSNHNISVVLKSITSSYIKQLSVTKVIEGDSYSVQVSIPENMPFGKYEVFLHNGYGDNTCWSQPVICTIGSSASSSWSSKGLFNVKDFGAVGDDTVNDTPAIISAMQAAYENGGGTVYFPKGTYRVITTIAVPEYVTVLGESKENTMIFWTANRWQYGEAKNLFSFVGNVEFKNLNIYCTRVAAMFKINPIVENKLINCIFGDPVNNRRNDNVYIDNLMLRSSVTAGNATNGGNAWSQVSGVSKLEYQTAVRTEAATHKINLNAGGRNYQISNTSMYNAGMEKDYIQSIYVKGYYVNINHFESYDFGVNGIVRNGLFEDNSVEFACIGLYGNNLYYARNNHSKVLGNNRELWVSDGVPYYLNQTIQFVGERDDIVGTGNTDNVTYKAIGYSRLPKNAFAGMVVYVTEGQGFGQERSIISSEVDGTFVIDNPFAISPNRNSKVYFYYPRCNNYFVQNVFEEGSGTGPWGTSVDAVWDGNICRYHSGQQFTSNQAVVWYTTIANEKYENPLYIHGEGFGGTLAGGQTERMLLLNASVSPCSKAFMGTVIKNNDFSGWYINLRMYSSLSDNITDLIIEHNNIDGVKNAIVCTAANSEYYDGVYIRDNDISAYANITTNNMINVNSNKCGYKRCIIVWSGQSVTVLGDVNLDGIVSLKDSTLIRYYYIQSISLSDDQLLRGDVNYDGKVDLKDATRIRQYVLGVISLENNTGDGSGYYPGIW